MSEVIANTPEGFERLERHRAGARLHGGDRNLLGIRRCLSRGKRPCRQRDKSGPDQSVRIRRTKTDKKDARLIARFCAERKPPLWEPSAPETSELRDLVTHRDALERMRTQEMNRLHVARAEIRQSVERHISYLEREIDAEN